MANQAERSTAPPAGSIQSTSGLSQEELAQQSAQDMPDREAMTVLSGTLTEPLVAPVEGLLQSSILDQVASQLPSEVAGIDLQGVATGTLGDGTSPLDALPPELVPDTTQITESQTISDQTAA